MDEPSDEELDALLKNIPDYASDDEAGKAAARTLVRFVVHLRVEKGYTHAQVQALMKEAGVGAHLIEGDDPASWIVKDDDGNLH
jgi:hypothetical protein